MPRLAMNRELTDSNANTVKVAGRKMRYSDLSDFLKTGVDILAKGPIALLLIEDLVEQK